jgi:hypothetical protein
MKTIINAILFGVLLSMASSSFASDDYYAGDQLDEGDVIVDVLLARPLGAFGTFVGGVTHLVGLLFSVPGENFAESGEVMVEAPLNYTFNRPLGRFDDDRD